MSATVEKMIHPLPWRAGPHQGVMTDVGVFDVNDVLVFGNVTEDEAQFIVTACNAHHDALAALQLAQELLARNGITRPEIDAALAKTEGATHE